MPIDERVLAEWLRVVRAEYLEVPGMHLTKAEMQRLWGLDAHTCDALVGTLVERRFLRLIRRDRYARFDAGA
jgi:hypothetical protein